MAFRFAPTLLSMPQDSLEHSGKKSAYVLFGSFCVALIVYVAMVRILIYGLGELFNPSKPLMTTNDSYAIDIWSSSILVSMMALANLVAVIFCHRCNRWPARNSFTSFAQIYNGHKLLFCSVSILAMSVAWEFIAIAHDLVEAFDLVVNAGPFFANRGLMFAVISVYVIRAIFFPCIIVAQREDYSYIYSRIHGHISRANETLFTLRLQKMVCLYAMAMYVVSTFSDHISSILMINHLRPDNFFEHNWLRSTMDFKLNIAVSLPSNILQCIYYGIALYIVCLSIKWPRMNSFDSMAQLMREHVWFCVWVVYIMWVINMSMSNTFVMNPHTFFATMYGMPMIQDKVAFAISLSMVMTLFLSRAIFWLCLTDEARKNYSFIYSWCFSDATLKIKS